jgi:hypothetical protein
MIYPKTLLPRSFDCVKPFGGRMIEMAVSGLTPRLAIPMASTTMSAPFGTLKNWKMIHASSKHLGLVENNGQERKGILQRQRIVFRPTA